MPPFPVILITGATSPLGRELTSALRAKFGRAAVIAADLNPPIHALEDDGPYYRLDVLDKYELHRLVSTNGVTQLYHLAEAPMTSEHINRKTWQQNIDALLNVLEIAREEKLQVFWPSSIMVYGRSAPKFGCAQDSPTAPYTTYGMFQAAGEQFCAWHRHQHSLDVRSLRYPGLTSADTQPSGKITDYVLELFQAALEKARYTCYLAPETMLPMMHTADAARAAVELMAMPAEKLKNASAYNIAAVSFSPLTLAEEIRKHIPAFGLAHVGSNRQRIADSLPGSITDEEARREWHWRPKYNLSDMAMLMLQQLRTNNTGTMEKACRV